MGKPIPVWLDCDPGHDDAFAILLAAYHPGINLLGISTIFGNAPLDQTTWNATSILTAIGKPHIPVHIGAPKPLVRPPFTPPQEIHGTSGIDGTDLLPRPLTPANTTIPAITACANAILATPPGTAWLIATGCLTNIATLLRTHPTIAGHIAGLSLMGGAIGGSFTPAIMGSVGNQERVGNWTTHAEFNIVIDPEAAAEVFSHEGLKGKITMIPLDVTHLCLATREVQGMLLFGRSTDSAAAWAGTGAWGKERHLVPHQQFGQPPTSPTGGNIEESETEERDTKASVKGKSNLRTMLVDLLTFFAKTYTDVFGITEGPPLHDPLAVAAALVGTEWEIPFFDNAPGGVGGKERYDVRVVTEGTLEEAKNGAETGRTIATLLEEGKEGVRIPRGLDIEMFWAAIEDCVERADEVNVGRGVF